MVKFSTQAPKYILFRLLFGVWLVLLILIQNQALGQTVIIPRDGFPYCEPFTNSTTRANTVFDGIPNPAFLTAGAGDPEGSGYLQLTDNTTDERGYVFIDLPFSSAYGIKVSFEYFAYGGINPPAFADGISFFMFDGDIGPSDFRIGGLGGSLGYAPWRRNANLTSIPDQPGLKGGYIGIGFDAFRNWGNEYEGRFGGFKDPNAEGFGPVPDERQYYNSIAIRGPETTNYQFIDGKRTYSRSFLNEEQPLVYTDPIDPDYYLFNDLDPVDYLARRFKIGADNLAELCTQDGYRKVFIDLFPIGGGNYLVTVDMLVNNGGTLRLENIFTDVPYNFPAPKNLKIGFAASTGTPNTNFHRIRNVTAQVSDYASIPIPQIDDLRAEVCQGEENLFEFDVNLTSENSFLRCVQLFENDPGPPDNTPPTGGDPSLTNCGLSNVCIDKCDPNNNTVTLPGKGTFFVELEELTTGNFDEERFAASVRFVPESGFVGTAQIYYQVLDNYGLLSEANTITVVSNPDPIKIQDPTIVNPTCDGQSDGLLTDLIVGDLVDGFDYEWLFNGGSIGKTGASVGPLTGDEATFELQGLNIGTYTLVVWNPSDNGRCETLIDVIIDQEQGTPVDIELNNQVICEGQEVNFNPIIDPAFGSDAGAEFFWYLSADRTGGAITNGSTRIIDGETISFQIINEREIVISGLVSNGNNFKDYVFYVEAKEDNPGGNFCPYLGDVLTEARVSVYPPLDFTASKISDDVCLDGSGSIEAQVANPTSAITYFLTDSNGTVLQSNTSGDFTGLAKGNYEVFASSESPVCISEILEFEILGPDQPLSLASGNILNAYCGEDNGEISFEVLGGSPDPSGNYSVTVNGADISSFAADLTQPTPNTFTIANLAPGSYPIEAIDENGCQSSLTIVVEDLPIPEFDVEEVTICEGTDALLIPEVVSNTIGATPTYRWFKEDQANPGQYLPINDGDQDGDIAYSINSGELTISGIINANSPYTFYLEVAGDGVCPGDLIPAQVEVLKIPEAVFSSENVSCFGGSDGTISLESLDPNGSFTFTILETGESNTSGDFSNLGAGVYTIRIQEDGAPCFSEEVIEITQPAELQILNVNSTNPTCGEFNGSFSFDLIGGVKDYSIGVNGLPITDYTHEINGDRVEIRNLEPGSYSVEITDANNCSISNPNLVNLVNDDGLTVSLEPMDIEACFGLDAVIRPEFTNSLPVTPELRWYKDAALTQSVSNGTDSEGVNFQIDPSNGELTIRGLPEGTRNYYLEISGPGICTLVETAEVIVFPVLTASFDVENITCFGDSDGSITVNPSGGNGTFEVSINGGPFTSELIYENLSAGDYIFEIQNDFGCTYSETINVDGPDEAIQINNPTIVRASCGLDNGSIQDLQISGGWSDYSIEWRKGDVSGAVLPGDENGISDLAPDTYFLIVNDSVGCTETFEFEVGVSSDPVYEVVPPINNCVGNDVRVRPIHLAPDPSLPPAAATEVRWYKGPNQVDLIENGPDQDNPAIEYIIDDSDWLNPELLISGLPAGDYTYYFYVVCTDQEIEVEVSIYDTPAVTLEVSPITCFGDSNGTISFTAGTDADYTYSLDGATAVDQSAIESLNLPAGDYQLEVFTPAICSQLIDFTIEGPAAPLDADPLTGIDPGCGASNGKLFTTIAGGWAPYQIEVFKDGVSVGNHSSTDGVVELDGYFIGDYALTITDAEGCSISTNTISLIDGPTQILVDEVEVCANEVATLTPTLDPATTNTTFQWYFDQALTQPINSSATPASDGLTYQFDSGTGVMNISGFDPNEATFTYFVTVSGSSICEGFVGEGVVEVFGIPSGTASVVDEVCFGEGGQITVNATGGSGSYTYSLNGGEFVNDPVFNVPTGTYTVEILSSAGCSILLEDILVEGPNSALESTNLNVDSPTCGLDNGIIRFDLDGGYLPYTVYYAKNGGAENSLVVNQAGTVDIANISVGDYRIRIVDNAGCEILIPQEIEVIEVPTEITAEDQYICLGEIATLSPSVPQNITDESFTWYFDANGTEPIINGSNVDGITYTISSAGELSVAGLAQDGSPYTYYVNATGTGICGIEPRPVQVIVNRIPDLRVSNPSVVCDPNGTVDLTRYIEGFNPEVYEYDILSPNGSAMQVSDIGAVDLSGDYRVSSSVKGSGCWNQPQRIRVIIADELLVADFEYEVDLGDGTIVTDDTVQIFEEIQFEDLSSGQVILWSWDFGDGSGSSDPNPVHLYEEEGTYTIQLQVIDEFGCVSIYEQVIQVSDDYWVKVPNAFTPSRPDGKNSFFKPVFRGIAEMEFYVFTTWGELIYETNSLEDQGWDGQFKGVEAPNGNYVYRGKFTSRSGEVVEKSGVFILIR